ncbi:MAG: hypothetical protein ACRD96_23485, partial [Bryobacteraceae bacterium]
MRSGWRKVFAVVLLLVGVHVIFTAMALAGYTLLIRAFNGPAAGAILIYFGLWALTVWGARR